MFRTPPSHHFSSQMPPSSHQLVMISGQMQTIKLGRKESTFHYQSPKRLPPWSNCLLSSPRQLWLIRQTPQRAKTWAQKEKSLEKIGVLSPSRGQPGELLTRQQGSGWRPTSPKHLPCPSLLLPLSQFLSPKPKATAAWFLMDWPLCFIRQCISLCQYEFARW